MYTPDLKSTLKQLIHQNPDTLGLLKRHGIDPLYASNLTLTEVCAMHGLSVKDLVQEMEEKDRDSRFLSQEMLESYDIPALVGYILSTHHVFLRKELPRLEKWLGDSVSQDGTAHPEIPELLDLFQDFRVSLEWHMDEEEKNLFPYFLELAATSPESLGNRDELESLTKVFEAEEDRVQADLEVLRKKTKGYQDPPGVSQATLDLYHDLFRMEFEIHRHIHDENNILYPKVFALWSRSKAKKETRPVG